MTFLRGLPFLLLLGGCVTASVDTSPELFVESTQLVQDFASSESCKACHPVTYDEYAESMHHESFANKVFRAQYLKDVLPRAEKDPGMADEARRCIVCHAPTSYMKHRRALTASEVSDDVPGVTCDFCHTLSGMSSSGDFLSRPEKKKLGPYELRNSWHSEYGGFITISEFCASCHNATNRNGLEVKSTYTEWKSSVYAQRGVQCQDCHMNVRGYLTADGKAEHEKGKAAYLSIGFGAIETPERDKLYTHLFPGAHSKNQINEILSLKIAAPAAVKRGERFPLSIFVDNTKTGHKMPSGSTNLRMMYLDVTLESDGKEVRLHAPSSAGPGNVKYDVAGAFAADPAVATGVPAGARVYRTIFADGSGQMTLSSYDAVKIIFDNRLNAAETRREVYNLGFDRTAQDAVTVTAKLVYLPYPAAFTSQLGVPNPEPVVVTSTTKKIIIR